MSVNLGTNTKHIASGTMYDDWFLPSVDELSAMYTNLHLEGIGAFNSLGIYFSSSEFSSNAIYSITFNDGVTHTDTWKGSINYVRACRTFVATTGDYILKDTGPAGGLIFYINDEGATSIYLEAAPSDQSPGTQIWSNVTSTEIGTTSTGVHQGGDNTVDIIAQIGHTDSAAKLCDDLVVTL